MSDQDVVIVNKVDEGTDVDNDHFDADVTWFYWLILIVFILFLVILLIVEWRKRFFATQDGTSSGQTSFIQIDTGPTGPIGHRGQAGSTGQRGLTGPQGITGPTGFSIPIDETGNLTDGLIASVEAGNSRFGIGVVLDFRSDFGVPTGLLGPQNNHLDVYLPFTELWYDYGPWLGVTGQRGTLGFTGRLGNQATGPTGISAPTGPTGPTGSFPVGFRGQTGHAGPPMAEYGLYDALGVSNFSKWSPATDGSLIVEENTCFKTSQMDLFLDHLYVPTSSTLVFSSSEPWPVARIFVAGNCVIEGNIVLQPVASKASLKSLENDADEWIESCFWSMIQSPVRMSAIGLQNAFLRHQLKNIGESDYGEHGGLLVVSAPEIRGSGTLHASGGKRTGNGGWIVMKSAKLSSLGFNVESLASSFRFHPGSVFKI